MVNINEDQIRAIGNVLQDPKRPLKERFRALFTLKNLGGTKSIECIEKAFEDDSALLKHELAYCLGQMQNKDAINVLIRILEDIQQEPMVRHEAGNISTIQLLSVTYYVHNTKSAILHIPTLITQNYLSVKEFCLVFR